MEGFPTAEAQRRYAEIARAGEELAVALDFDGTLAPIVADPTQAYIAPEAPDVLADLATRVRALAVITGRPVQQVLDLGGFERLGERVRAHGRELFVLGQYGNEHWTSGSPVVAGTPVPAGMPAFLDELPHLLEEAGLDPLVEEKGIAVAVHTRSLEEPATAYEALLPVLTAAAHRHGLQVEPGRLVVEVRGPGMDKGRALRDLVEEVGAGAVLFAGDDLGDLDAFAAVEDLRAAGLPGLAVSARRDEGGVLVDRADVVVDGPSGVLALLRRLAVDLTAA